MATWGGTRCSTKSRRGHRPHRSTAGTYPHTCFERGTWKPRTSLVGTVPASGRTARRADRCAGLRCRKKPMPRCNRADTGPRWPGAKASPRPTGLSSRENRRNHQQEGKQMTGALSTWCALRLRKEARWQPASIAKVEIAESVSTGSPQNGLSRGSSRMTGNCHVRFLGGPGPERARGLPGGRHPIPHPWRTQILGGDRT